MMALVLASCSKQGTAGDVELQMCASISPEMTVIVRGGESQEEPVIANHAILQVWREGVMTAKVETSIIPGTREISFSGIKLAGGAEYLIYIWVDCAGYYNTEDLRKVSVKQPYDGKTADFDAFYSFSTVTCRQNDEVHSVSLKRPFAKLCFSAQLSKPLNVKYSAPTTLNLIDGQVSGVRDVEYTVQPEPGETSVEAFDYVFAKDGIAQMNYTFKLGEEERTTSVPVARNTITNIIYNTN